MKTDPISPQPPYRADVLAKAALAFGLDNTPVPPVRHAVGGQATLLALLLAKALNCLSGHSSIAQVDDALEAVGIRGVIKAVSEPAGPPSLEDYHRLRADGFVSLPTGVVITKEELFRSYGHLSHHLTRQIERAAIIGRAIEMGAHAAVRKWCNELDNATPIEARIFPGPDTLILKESVNLKPEPEAHRPVEANPQVTVMEEIL